MTFNELEFKEQQRPWTSDRIQAVVSFSNGYGASVVKGATTYGGKQGLYELAITKLNENSKWEICYDTPITNDVIGYLTEDDVIGILKQIEQL